MSIIDPTIFDGIDYNDLWLGKSVIEPDRYAKSEHMPIGFRDLKKCQDGPDHHIQIETTLELAFKVRQKRYYMEYRIWNRRDKIFCDLVECRPV
jgi:hypothetical protein